MVLCFSRKSPLDLYKGHHPPQVARSASEYKKRRMMHIQRRKLENKKGERKEEEVYVRIIPMWIGLETRCCIL